ncbi:MAG: hypothetical protein U0441_33500 [Polyangiaceae bacterium]
MRLLRRARGASFPLVTTLAFSLSPFGCGGGETSGDTTTTTETSPSVSALRITLSRGVSGEVGVTVHAEDASGAPVDGATLVISAQGGVVGPMTAKSGGDYEVALTPEVQDGEIAIQADSGSIHAEKTAIVLTDVDDGWDQAEAVDGLVNTAGWEDGASVSPDGEWLLIGTYVPVDVFGCLVFGDGTSADTRCNTVLGPYTAPERPDMLGAERIVSPTKIKHACPSLGFPAGGGEASFPLIPVSAYGFHRQADGSYAEPFVVGYAADGCLGPYGLSFAGPITGTTATALFANDDPLTSGAGDTSTDLYWTPLTLGQKNILATYTFDGQKSVVSGDVTVRLPLPDLAGTQGNVNLAGGRLWWDDESLPEAERQLSFADVTGTLPQAMIGPTKIASASRTGAGDIQPALDGDTLYWMGDGHILTADLASGADPSLPASWTPAKAIVGPGMSPSGRVLAVGEPTIAHVGAETWLYFVYILKTDLGYNANVGRIRRRNGG